MKDLLKRLDDVKQKEAVLSMNENGGNEAPHSVPIDFSKIKVGLQTLKDATLEDIAPLKKVNPRLCDKREIQRAIAQNDLDYMRDVSNFFYRVSGIYQRLVKYLAYMYRYD